MHSDNRAKDILPAENTNSSGVSEIRIHPNDISSNTSDEPMQTKIKQIILKHCLAQLIKPDFSKSYPWILENAVYCFHCRHFPDKSKVAHKQTFTKSGFYYDWKHAGGHHGTLASHHKLQFHIVVASIWSDH